jgi:predicted porin
MKTPLLALAVAGALAGAAHAQSNLAVYGALDAGQLKRIGATLAIGQRGAATQGFKAVEELGPGLKALIGLEIRYEPDSGTADSGAQPLFQGQGRAGNPFSIAGTYQDGSVAAMLGYERRGVDASPFRPMASLAGQERGHPLALNEHTTAWVVGANYTLASGTVLLGYGRKEPDRAAASRQLSIGYAYPLSKHSYLYADASDKKAAGTVRQFDIGVRASF